MKSEVEIRKALGHFRQAATGAAVHSDKQAFFHIQIMATVLTWVLEEERAPEGQRVADIIADCEAVDAASQKAARN